MRPTGTTNTTSTVNNSCQRKMHFGDIPSSSLISFAKTSFPSFDSGFNCTFHPLSTHLAPNIFRSSFATNRSLQATFHFPDHFSLFSGHFSLFPGHFLQARQLFRNHSLVKMDLPSQFTFPSTVDGSVPPSVPDEEMFKKQLKDYYNDMVRAQNAQQEELKETNYRLERALEEKSKMANEMVRTNGS